MPKKMKVMVAQGKAPTSSSLPPIPPKRSPPVPPVSAHAASATAEAMSTISPELRRNVSQTTLAALLESVDREIGRGESVVTEYVVPSTSTTPTPSPTTQTSASIEIGSLMEIEMPPPDSETPEIVDADTDNDDEDGEKVEVEDEEEEETVVVVESVNNVKKAVKFQNVDDVNEDEDDDHVLLVDEFELKRLATRCCVSLIMMVLVMLILRIAPRFEAFFWMVVVMLLLDIYAHHDVFWSVERILRRYIA